MTAMSPHPLIVIAIVGNIPVITIGITLVFGHVNVIGLLHERHRHNGLALILLLHDIIVVVLSRVI
jgi:hypothetical protein